MVAIILVALILLLVLKPWESANTDIGENPGANHEEKEDDYYPIGKPTVDKINF